MNFIYTFKKNMLEDEELKVKGSNECFLDEKEKKKPSNNGISHENGSQGKIVGTLVLVN